MESFNQLWHYGFELTEKNITEGNKTSKTIANTLLQLAKIEQQYSSAIASLIRGKSYELPVFQKQTEFENHWNSFMVGFSNIGKEHGKHATILKNEGENLHKWRYSEREVQRRVHDAGKTEKKILSDKKWNQKKCESIYKKSIVNLENTIERQNQALSTMAGDKRKMINSVDKHEMKVKEAQKMFYDNRNSYIQAVTDSQNQQLIHRDAMIQCQNVRPSNMNI